LTLETFFNFIPLSNQNTDSIFPELLPTKTPRAIVKASKTKSSSDKTAKQNNHTTASGMNDSLVSELTATDSTTASFLAASQPNPDGDFIRFPKLPAELREIWILSLAGPRDILIRFDPQDMEDVKLKKKKLMDCRPKAYGGPVPAHLHANHESRDIAKKYYQLNLEEQTQGRPICINFEVDTICFLDLSHSVGILDGQRSRLGANKRNREKNSIGCFCGIAWLERCFRVVGKGV
jgi:hypothetical protein